MVERMFDYAQDEEGKEDMPEDIEISHNGLPLRHGLYFSQLALKTDWECG